jgi:uncharacterized membrane protein YkvI
MRNKRNSAFLVAATYIGTVVGAGFATGKEIVTFFSIYGALGTVGIFISGVLFIFVGTKIMILSSRIQAYSYQEFNLYLFGQSIGKIVNILFFLVLIGVTSVMLSGAGAVFQEQIGLPYQLGIIVTLLLCYAVILKGLDGILAVNLLTVPLMIGFSLLLAVIIFLHFPGSVIENTFTVRDGLGNKISWLIAPFTYAAFNLATAQAVLVPLGKEIEDENMLRRGGFWGGAGLCLILLASHLSMSVFPEMTYYEVPMAEVVKLFGTAIHLFFLLVIYSEIFNTVLGNVFGVTRHIEGTFNISHRIVVISILFVVFVISQFGYGKLLMLLYPLFGYMGLFVFIYLLFKKLP